MHVSSPLRLVTTPSSQPRLALAHGLHAADDRAALMALLDTLMPNSEAIWDMTPQMDDCAPATASISWVPTAPHPKDGKMYPGALIAHTVSHEALEQTGMLLAEIARATAMTTLTVIWCGDQTDGHMNTARARIERTLEQGQGITSEWAVAADAVPALMQRPSSFEAVLFIGGGAELMHQAFAARKSQDVAYASLGVTSPIARISNTAPLTGEALISLIILALLRDGMVQLATRLWDAYLVLTENRVFSDTRARLSPYGTNLPLSDYMDRLTRSLGRIPQKSAGRLTGNDQKNGVTLTLV